MESEFTTMRQALLRLVEEFTKKEDFQDWEVHCFSEGPKSFLKLSDDSSRLGPQIHIHSVSLGIRCRRPCCYDGPDEMAHELCVYFKLYEEDNKVIFKLFLNGLPEHNEQSFPRIEGWTAYNIDSFPQIRLQAPKLESVLDVGKRLLALVPEWHRFLAEETTDWETRLEMKME